MQMVHRRYFISYRPTGLFVFFSHLKNNVPKPSTWAYYNTLHSGVQGQALTNKQAMLSNFRIYSGNIVKQNFKIKRFKTCELGLPLDNAPSVNFPKEITSMSYGVQGQALTNKQAMLSNFRIYSGNIVKQNFKIQRFKTCELGLPLDNAPSVNFPKEITSMS